MSVTHPHTPNTQKAPVLQLTGWPKQEPSKAGPHSLRISWEKNINKISSMEKSGEALDSQILLSLLQGSDKAPQLLKSIRWQPHLDPHKSPGIYDTVTPPVSHMIHSVMNNTLIKELHFHFCSYLTQKAQSLPRKGTQATTICHSCCWNFFLNSKTRFQD